MSMVVQVDAAWPPLLSNCERIIPGREMLVDHEIRVVGRDTIALNEDMAFWVEQGKPAGRRLGPPRRRSDPRPQLRRS